MRRSGFLTLFLLILPSVLMLAAPADPATAVKTDAPAVKTDAPAAQAPAAKPDGSVKPDAPAKPIYPEESFRPVFRAKQDPADFADPVRAAELFQAREQLIQSLLSERRRILIVDPKAREIHDKIIELNKQLAVVLESKRAVRELSRDLMLIDARINALERKAPQPETPSAAPQTSTAPAK